MDQVLKLSMGGESTRIGPKSTQVEDKFSKIGKWRKLVIYDFTQIGSAMYIIKFSINEGAESYMH